MKLLNFLDLTPYNIEKKFHLFDEFKNKNFEEK